MSILNISIQVSSAQLSAGVSTPGADPGFKVRGGGALKEIVRKKIIVFRNTLSTNRVL